MRYQKHESFWADFKIYLQIFIRAIIIGLVFLALFLLYSTSDVRDNLEHIYTIQNVKLPVTIAIKYYTGFGNIFSKGIPVEEEFDTLCKWVERVT